MKFIPDNENSQLSPVEIPYFEDVRTEDAPGYRTKLSLNQLKEECLMQLAKLGAGNVTFTSGTFDATQPRSGFIITFTIYGTNARIQIAGFPMRTKSEKKTEQVLKQALFVFRDWLKGEVQMRVYHPDYLPLAQYLTGGDGKPTVMESLRSSGNLPLLKG